MYGNRGYGRDTRDFGRTPPVREGEELDARIEAVGEKGDGVAKKDGFVLFVPNVKEGDEVRIRVTKVLRKVGFAEVIGQAQGPIGESAPKRQPSAAESKIKEMQAVAAKAAHIEDSEDFGDEPAEEEQELADEPEEATEDEETEELKKPSISHSELDETDEPEEEEEKESF